MTCRDTIRTDTYFEINIKTSPGILSKHLHLNDPVYRTCVNSENDKFQSKKRFTTTGLI